jgi:hypothetical protein
MRAASLSRFIICSLPLCLSMTMAAPSHPQTLPGTDGLATLYGLKLDHARITIEVLSSGCTEASHFSVRIDSEEPDTYHLSIIRHRQDGCKMSRHIVSLTLAREP